MAIASYQHAEDAGLMFPEVLNNHAGALADDGRFVEARMILESAQAFAPEDEVIKLNLSTLHAINQASASSLETVKQNFITEDIRIDFLSFQMNTVPLRTAA
jgi:Flp pilus assembly protein TadD